MVYILSKHVIKLFEPTQSTQPARWQACPCTLETVTLQRNQHRAAPINMHTVRDIVFAGWVQWYSLQMFRWNLRHRFSVLNHSSQADGRLVGPRPAFLGAQDHIHLCRRGSARLCAPACTHVMYVTGHLQADMQVRSMLIWHATLP